MPQEDTSTILLAPAPPAFEDSLGYVPAIWRVHLPADGADGDFRFDLGNGQTLQILDGAVSGETIAVAVVPLDLDGFDRIEAIRRFLSALHGRAIPPDTRLTRQQRIRQQRMLRAFDGYRAGATQQEIAQVILHTDRLDRRMAGILGPPCHQIAPARCPCPGRGRISKTPASSPSRIAQHPAPDGGRFRYPPTSPCTSPVLLRHRGPCPPLIRSGRRNTTEARSMPHEPVILPPRFLRTKEAADFLSLSARTLEKHRTYGTGPAYRKLGGRVVYAIDDLEAWAARGAVTSTSDPRGSVLPAKRQTLPAGPQPGRYAR